MFGDPLTIPEVAKICGVDEATVQIWIKKKKLRSRRDSITGIAYVRRDSLAIFLRKLGFPQHVISLVLLRKLFTTGEVAKICNVAPRTVVNWVDSGILKGFRIPGSAARRIPREELARFLKERGMPLGQLERDLHRDILFVAGRNSFEQAQSVLKKQGNYVCKFVDNIIDAAFEISERKCQVAVIDFEIGRGDAVELARKTRYRTGPALWMIAVAAEDEVNSKSLYKSGFNDVVKKPLDIGILVSKVLAFFESP